MPASFLSAGVRPTSRKTAYYQDLTNWIHSSVFLQGGHPLEGRGDRYAVARVTLDSWNANQTIGALLEQRLRSAPECEFDDGYMRVLPSTGIKGLLPQPQVDRVHPTNLNALRSERPGGLPLRAEFLNIQRSKFYAYDMVWVSDNVVTTVRTDGWAATTAYALVDQDLLAVRAGTDVREPSVLVAPTRIEAMPMADVAPVMGQFGRLDQETGVFVPHDTVPEMPTTPTRERSWDLVGTPAKRPRTAPEMRSLTRSPPRERSPSFAPPPAPKRARAGPPAPPPPPPPAASGDGSRWVEITVFLTLIGILILIEENEAHAGGRRGRGAY